MRWVFKLRHLSESTVNFNFSLLLPYNLSSYYTVVVVVVVVVCTRCDMV